MSKYYCFEVRFDDESKIPEIGPDMELFGSPVTAVRFAPLDDTKESYLRGLVDKWREIAKRRGDMLGLPTPAADDVDEVPE